MAEYFKVYYVMDSVLSIKYCMHIFKLALWSPSLKRI
jgi:hypothetical protein